MQGSKNRTTHRPTPEVLDILDWAHRRVRLRPEEFQLAGRYLDLAYSEASVRNRRRLFDERGETVGGFLSAHQIVVTDEMSGPIVLQARLSSAVTDLIAFPPDMTPLAAEDPLVQARLVVLVACLATDRDAGKYCSGVTDLASLEWLDDQVWGRSMVAPDASELASWALLELIGEARACIERRGNRGAPGKPKSATEPAVPATLDELVRSVVAAECGTEYFLSSYAEAGRLHGIYGPFKQEHLPEYRSVAEAYRSHRVAADREAMRRGGEELPDVMFVAPDQWEGMLDEFIDAYRAFVAKAEHAMDIVDACVRDGLHTVPALPAHFLLELKTTLRFIVGAWHPTTLGRRGLGAVRAGCPDVGEDYLQHVRELQRLRVMLQSVASVDVEAQLAAEVLEVACEDRKTAKEDPAVSECEQSAPCFVKRGTVWEVRFGEEARMFRHLDGMTYIHGLLREPNPSRDLRAVEVLTWKTGNATPKAETQPFEDDILHEGGAGTPLADAEAISEYKERLVIVNDELCENKNTLTLDERIRFEQERSILLETLGEVLGVSDRQREFQRRDEENARKRVSQAIKRCVKIFAADGMPEFAEHLRLHLTPSGYRPGPNPPPWSLNGM